MNFIEKMKKKARSHPKDLVLPEGTEPRIVQTADYIMRNRFASSVTLIGEPSEIKAIARQENVSLEGICIECPWRSPLLKEYSWQLYQLRRHKGIDLEEARQLIIEPVNWSSMTVLKSTSHAMVAGAGLATATILRSVFTIIGTCPGTQFASSYFVMYLPHTSWGAGGYLFFADCATVPDPNETQLSEIAITTANSFRRLIGEEPVVALLSSSTHGSASHALAEKVNHATEIAHDRNPDLQIDGELQLDAALIPTVCEKKAPGSPVAGRANVLIFPNIDAGNIGYKLVQRLAGARAFGPFLQGIARSVSDLSRGATVEDIVNTAIVTLVMAQDSAPSEQLHGESRNERKSA